MTGIPGDLVYDRGNLAGKEDCMDEKYRINAVTITDSWGKVRATLSLASNGEPYLAILGREGEICALFSIDPNREPYVTRTR